MASYEYGLTPRVVPDAQVVGWEHPGNHGPSAQAAITKLKQIQETLVTLGEQGVIGDGHLVSMSDLLCGVFNALEGVEEESGTIGAYSVGVSMLVLTPHAGRHAHMSEFLTDRKFCTVLTTIKVEAIRIERGDPTQGPLLTNLENARLGFWATDLLEGAMTAWSSHFLSSNWPPSCARVRAAQVDAGIFQVPGRFQTLVCNLISMRLDLWPGIVKWLKRFNVTGPNIFPASTWSDAYLQQVMASEPRMISFVVGADHLSITEFARIGPVRRSDKARKGGDLGALTEGARALMRDGIYHIQTVYKGVFDKQGPKTPHRAIHYEWPRESSPSMVDLLGTAFAYA